MKTIIVIIWNANLLDTSLQSSDHFVFLRRSPFWQEEANKTGWNRVLSWIAQNRDYFPFLSFFLSMFFWQESKAFHFHLVCWRLSETCTHTTHVHPTFSTLLYGHWQQWPFFVQSRMLFLPISGGIASMRICRVEFYSHPGVCKELKFNRMIRLYFIRSIETMTVIASPLICMVSGRRLTLPISRWISSTVFYCSFLLFDLF